MRRTFALVNPSFWPSEVCKNIFYFLAEDLKAYAEHQIVFPYVVDGEGNFLSHNIHHRSRRSLDPLPAIHYHIPFKNERFHLELKPNNGFMVSGLEVEWRSGKRTRADRNCHFIGSIRNYTKSSVAISNCRGLVSSITYHSVSTRTAIWRCASDNPGKMALDKPGAMFGSWISCEIHFFTRQVWFVLSKVESSLLSPCWAWTRVNMMGSMPTWSTEDLSRRDWGRTRLNQRVVWQVQPP